MKSPWTVEYVSERKHTPLTDSLTTDTVVVGAGIAGVTTAYELLSRTDKNVVLVDAGKVGGGATGYNAGQLVPDVERTLASLVEEYGEEKTSRLVIDLEQSWRLLDAMIVDLGLTTPINYFMGSCGARGMSSLMQKLHEEMLRVKLGAERKLFVVREDIWRTLTSEEQVFTTPGTARQIQAMLEVRDESFLAAWSWSGAVGNSARMCEDIVHALLERFPERLHVFEDTCISTVVLRNSDVVVRSGSHEVTADKVVLATNGFESLTIEHEGGGSLDSAFHYEVRGAVGFMAGYLVEDEYPPMAQAYFGTWNESSEVVYDKEILEEPYFYLTRRPYQGKTLVVIGGPEDFIDDTRTYSKEYPYPKQALESITTFMAQYQIELPETPDFAWHGLMGYTRSGVRLVGPEPKNPRLIYNLGCNGIGIMPSLIAARRVGQMLSGEVVEPSVFDPR